MLLRGAPGAPVRSAALRCRSTAPAATSVSRVGFKGEAPSFAPILNGCWQLAGGHGREVFDGILEKLAAHADAGFDTFDTADIYGPSEKILGQFIASRAAAGQPDVRVFTKYVPNIFNSRPTPASVAAALQRSAAALGVSQLDLVQLHWWDYSIPGMVDVGLALADAQAKGLVRAVGVTNMDVPAVEALLAAGVPVVSNQVQFSLLDRRPLNGMLALCKAQDIRLFSNGSLAGGLLSDQHVVAAPKQGLFGGARYPNVDLNTSSLKMYWNVARQFGSQELWRELLRVLRRVADGRGGDVTVANVALLWVIGKGVQPIVGLRGVSHIQDNARVLSLPPLTPDELAQIDEVLGKAQGPAGDIYSFERGA